MATITLGLFLLMFGIMNLFQTSIPPWVLGLLALFAGLMLIAGRFTGNPNLK